MDIHYLIIRLMPFAIALSFVIIKFFYIRSNAKHFIGRLEFRHIRYYDKEYIDKTSSEQKQQFMVTCNMMNTFCLIAFVSGLLLLAYDYLF